MKKKQHLYPSKLNVIAFALVFVAILSCCNNNREAAVRVGWQPPWVNQGQIVEVLKHSKVLEKYNVNVDFKPFTYGGPMTEAALAGDLDILFAGDQPAITLISKDSNWKIVARMTNYRSAIIIPSKSELKTLVDLKGKRIAAAFGSTTYRDLIRELLRAGIDPEKDVKLINVDQAEHATIIMSEKDNKWGEIDAIATYDPTIAIGIVKTKAKILKEWTSPSVVVATSEIINKKPEVVRNFLKAYKEAFTIYSKNPSKFNTLYSNESRLQLNDSTYFEMSRMEPNMSKSNIHDVSINNSGERIKLIDQNAKLAFKIGIIKKEISIISSFNNKFTTSN
jgi:ABC-type nitrate/sulfonate/bicarbonate transport system substrate-binding protein